MTVFFTDASKLKRGMQPDRQRACIYVHIYVMFDWIYNHSLTYTAVTSISIFTCTFWLKFIKETRSTVVTAISNAWRI